MFGWINDCTEKLVISKFGVETWHAVKEKAGCTVKDGGFIRHERYSEDDMRRTYFIYCEMHFMGFVSVHRVKVNNE